MRRVVHISDTHGLHREIPDADMYGDVLVHSGDFTEKGFVKELVEFNEWLGEIRPRFKHVLIVLGNHEFKKYDAKDEKAVAVFGGPDWMSHVRRILSNATHVFHHESIVCEGIVFFGISWARGASGRSPDSGEKDYEQMTKDHVGDVDVLITHCPPSGIFDWMEGLQRPWGSSVKLREVIEERMKPTVHLFGHLHEQRGIWEKKDQDWVGGVEYQRSEGERWIENESPPPSKRYPCQLISCNAMKNNVRVDGLPATLLGKPRVLIARKDGESLWKFSV